MNVSGDTAFNSFAGAKSPAECEYGGCNAKGNDVGYRVQLQAKVTRRLGQTGDASVKAIEYVANADENSGVVPVPAQGGDDRIVAAEDIPDRKKAGDDREACSKARTIANTPLWPPPEH